MLNTIRAWRVALLRHRKNRRVIRALALNRRGEVRTDGLSVLRMEHRLNIQWIARQIHPWYRSLAMPRTEALEMFSEQCLEDTNSALERLFLALPETDIVDFTVIHPESRVAIVSGVVSRKESAVIEGISTGMKLKKLGVRFRLNAGMFLPLSDNEGMC